MIRDDTAADESGPRFGPIVTTWRGSIRTRIKASSSWLCCRSGHQFGAAGSNSANAEIDVDPYEHVLRVLLQPHIHGGAIWQDQSGSKKRFELWT